MNVLMWRWAVILGVIVFWVLVYILAPVFWELDRVGWSIIAGGLLIIWLLSRRRCDQVGIAGPLAVGLLFLMILTAAGF